MHTMLEIIRQKQKVDMAEVRYKARAEEYENAQSRYQDAMGTYKYEMDALAQMLKEDDDDTRAHP